MLLLKPYKTKSYKLMLTFATQCTASLSKSPITLEEEWHDSNKCSFVDKIYNLQ